VNTGDRLYFRNPQGKRAFRHFDLIDMLALPEISLRTGRAPGQHGETLFGFSAEPRIVQMTFKGLSVPCHEFLDLIDLTHVLREDPGNLTIGLEIATHETFELRNTKFLAQFEITDPLNLKVRNIGLRFKAFDPIWWGNLHTQLFYCGDYLEEALVFGLHTPVFGDTGTWLFGVYGGSIDTTMTFQLAGTWYAWPVITCVGPFDHIRLDHIELGVSLQLDYTSAVGEVIVFTTGQYGASVISSVAGDLRRHLAAQGMLNYFYFDPTLNAAQTNQIRLRTNGTTSAGSWTVSWNDRYVGI
jgi:hypothetical protein